MSTVPLSVTLGFAQQQLVRYVYSLWFILGVPGCLLDIVIFSRPRLRKTSCCIYFLGTCINNTVTLASGVGPVIYSLNNPNPLTHSLVFCKVRGYIFQINLMLSRWFVSSACIDRYLLSSENANYRRFSTVRVACRITLLIIIIWAVICSHRLIFYEIKGNVCGILSNTGAAMYHAIYVIVGGFILPSAIMIVCTYLLHRNLNRKRRIRHQEGTNPGILARELKQQSFDRQMLRLLIVQIICYILLSLPQMINLVYNTIQTTVSNLSADGLAIEGFVSFIAELMLYIFPVTSFYLYTLTSRTFRKEMMSIFRCVFFCWRSQRRNQVSPTMGHSTIILGIRKKETNVNASVLQSVQQD